MWSYLLMSSFSLIRFDVYSKKFKNRKQGMTALKNCRTRLTKRYTEYSWRPVLVLFSNGQAHNKKIKFAHVRWSEITRNRRRSEWMNEWVNEWAPEGAGHQLIDCDGPLSKSRVDKSGVSWILFFVVFIFISFNDYEFFFQFVWDVSDTLKTGFSFIPKDF